MQPIQVIKQLLTRITRNLSVVGAGFSVLGFLLAFLLNHPWAGYVTVAGALLILADTFGYWLAMGKHDHDR